MRASGVALLALVLLAPPAASAQDSLPVPPPVAPSADSADAYAALQEAVRTTVPVPPRLGPVGPRPAGARLVITRDSIDWSGAATVSDLLARIPGTFAWRGGGIGRPEPVNFRGRGAASTEFFLDGVPYTPIGPDSTGVDPALLPLGLVDRIEVVRWPGSLEVHLFTRANDREAAASHIMLAAGPGKLAHYEGAFERRFGSGLGVGAGLDYWKNPPPAGAVGEWDATHIWGQLSYVPTARGGLVVQYLGSSLDRDPFSDDGVAMGERVEGRRGELSLRAFVAGGADGQGPRVDVLGSRASFDSMGVDHDVWRAGAMVSWRTPRATLRAQGFYASHWTPIDAALSVAWSPVSTVTLTADAHYQQHEGDRTSTWAGVQAGLGLPAGFAVVASGRAGTQVAAPSVLASAEQDLREAEVGLVWSRPWVSLDARVARTGSWVPPSFHSYGTLVTLSEVPDATWLSVAGRLQPVGWFAVSGSYDQPTEPSVAGAPPRHWHLTGTIRSKFLRTFRSGAFDLKLELGYEGWRAGTLGLDGSGAAVLTPESHFLRSQVQVAIESFSVVWESRNLLNEPAAHVPAFRIPRYSGFFGVRWAFRN